jgi:gluconate 5-dehydrogenase
MADLESLFGVKSKIIVITGAVGYLGNVLCRTLLDQGSIVIGLDLKESSIKNKNFHFYSCDIASKEEVKETFSKIYDIFGRIDVLINNAGVSFGTNFLERTEEELDHVLNVNVKGGIFCIQSYVEGFDDHKMDAGAIINIGSIFGVVSPDFRNYTDYKIVNSEIYGASKAGVIQMTKYFACYLAKRKIRVNSVSPGGIFNELNPLGEDFVKKYSSRVPMGRMANVDEMVGAVMYFASNASSYTTGQNLVVDGGLTAW